MKVEDRDDARAIEESMRDPRPSVPWDAVKSDLGIKRALKVGDEVTWTSQAGGFTKTKRGTVVAVVPAERDPVQVARDAGLPRPERGLFLRDHESYLVSANRRLYWPRAAALKPVGPSPLKAVFEAAKAWRDVLFNERGFTLEEAVAARDSLAAAVEAAEKERARG